MSDPLAKKCVYCGSPDVLDDAWFCGHVGCLRADELTERVHGLEHELADLRGLCASVADKLGQRGNEEPLAVANRLRGLSHLHAAGIARLIHAREAGS